MEKRRARLVTLLVGALLSGSGEASAQELAEAGSFLLGRGINPAFRRALESAAEMLARPGCQEVLGDFRDGGGRTLRENLDVTGLAPREYLAQVYFTPGDRLRRCDNRNVLATTSPGSRVVFVCGAQFLSVQRQDARYSAYTLIHEMLHSLGLGENPPTPGQITERVRVRCGR